MFQPSNAAAAQSKGYAVQMDLADFTEEELLQNIHRVIDDPKYLTAAKHHSAILKDKQSGPGKRVSHLINHVLKFGDAHLRTGAYELNIPQFFMMDLFAVIFLCCLSVFIFLCLCLRCTYLCVKKRCRRSASAARAKNSNKLE